MKNKGQRVFSFINKDGTCAFRLVVPEAPYRTPRLGTHMLDDVKVSFSIAACSDDFESNLLIEKVRITKVCDCGKPDCSQCKGKQ
ncbi:hypothetical protein LCGC14_1205510 [marine sediment metagenome]|uniref:Uncharacterized protein n=1 Tax=marine sediment metagenome TaxID=412755 RepID=A0A0F9NXT3_9ZZZZ